MDCFWLIKHFSFTSGITLSHAQNRRNCHCFQYPLICFNVHCWPLLSIANSHLWIWTSMQCLSTDCNTHCERALLASLFQRFHDRSPKFSLMIIEELLGIFYDIINGIYFWQSCSYFLGWRWFWMWTDNIFGRERHQRWKTLFRAGGQLTYFTIVVWKTRFWRSTDSQRHAGAWSIGDRRWEWSWDWWNCRWSPCWRLESSVD